MAVELVPRIEGLPMGELRATFDACTTTLSERMDPFDYRSWSYYLERANAAFAMGQVISGVVEDLYHAARCLHGNEAIHLGRLEARRFLTRRVQPLELALASGHPALMADLAAAYGLSLPLVMSCSDPELDDEIALLTSHFLRQHCSDHRALVGLGAVVFAGSLAALARQFDDEAALGLETYGEARAALARVEPPESLRGRLRRYDALNLVLVDIVNGDAAPIGPRIDKLASAYEETTRHDAPAEAWAKQHWLDLSAVALIAAAMLRGLSVELPEGHAYQGFVDVFAAGPREDALVEAAELPAELVERLAGAEKAPEGSEE